MPKRVLISAGEFSGDIYGSLLAKELKKIDPSFEIVGAGGKLMKEAGVEIIDDTTRYSTVGIVEGIKNAASYLRLFRKYMVEVNRQRPDVVVLIDLPDFNFRLGRFLSKRGVPVIYYVSPQVWAWRGGRKWRIKKIASIVLVIFDFEEKIYKDIGARVKFVGHPILDLIEQYKFCDLRKELSIKDGETVVGLLPGSRPEEFLYLFEKMAIASDIIRKRIENARFLVAFAPTIPENIIHPRMRRGFDFVYNKTYDVLKVSDIAIIASGTATLEAAVFGVPMVVTYYLSPLTLMLVVPFLRVKNFAIVNILAKREIVPECYQNRARPEILADELMKVLKNRNKMKEELSKVKKMLGPSGASKRAAETIAQFLSS